MGKREERRLRAEAKREAIRKEIFEFMVRCVDEKVPENKVNFAVNAHIEGMKRRNPQENHLVSSVCCEIRADVKGFCDRMMASYGPWLNPAVPSKVLGDVPQPVEKA